MRHVYTTQVISPFGSGYVPENHGEAPGFLKASTGRAAKWLAVVAVLALGITTATAITKLQHAPASNFSWSQSGNFVNLPAMGAFEQALY